MRPERKQNLVNLVKRLLKSERSVKDFLNRVLIAIATNVSLPFQILRQLFILISDLFHANHYIFCLFELSTQLSDFFDCLISTLLDFSLQSCPSLLDLFDLLSHDTYVLFHVFQEELLVLDLLPELDLAHLIVVDLSV